MAAKSFPLRINNTPSDLSHSLEMQRIEPL
jgi:hypothetical protein